MAHEHASPPDGERQHRRRVPLVVILGGISLTFALTVTGLAYRVLGETTDERIERHRGEAARKAEQIHAAYLSYHAERGEWPASVGDTLKAGSGGAPYLDGGRSALYDPWGKQFQVELRPDASGKSQPVVWTKDPRGQRVGFPSD